MPTMIMSPAPQTRERLSRDHSSGTSAPQHVLEKEGVRLATQICRGTRCLQTRLSACSNHLCHRSHNKFSHQMTYLLDLLPSWHLRLPLLGLHLFLVAEEWQAQHRQFGWCNHPQLQRSCSKVEDPRKNAPKRNMCALQKRWDAKRLRHLRHGQAKWPTYHQGSPSCRKVASELHRLHG